MSSAELKQQIHRDLRVQHPEWVAPNGECPACDAIELRLAKLLDEADNARDKTKSDGACVSRTDARANDNSLGSRISCAQNGLSVTSG